MYNESSNICFSFIVVSWNSEKYLTKCFESILHKCKEEEILVEIWVVDNGSQDKSIEIINDFQRNNPNIFQLIRLDRNNGTTYTRNLAIKKSQGQYICILDSDAELEKGSLRTIINFLETRDNIGIVAPKLVLPDGTVQNSVKRFPTMLNKLLKIPAILLGIDKFNSDFYENFPFQEERTVESAISACWFLSKKLVRKIGYLDEKIFYAPEDVDYCLRVCKSGFSNFYYPEFTVMHHTQQISHKKPFSNISISHLFGLIYFFRKHGGWVRRPHIE